MPISIRDNKLYQLGLEVNNLKNERDNAPELKTQIRDLTGQVKILVAQVDDLQSKLSKIYTTRAYRLYKLIKKFTI